MHKEAHRAILKLSLQGDEGHAHGLCIEALGCVLLY